MNVRGQDKRVGRYSGKTARRRKAIVTLTEDSNDIKFFFKTKNKTTKIKKREKVIGGSVNWLLEFISQPQMVAVI